MEGHTAGASNHKSSTQVYTVSTHDDDHFSGKLSVDDHLLYIEGSLEKTKSKSVSVGESLEWKVTQLARQIIL